MKKIILSIFTIALAFGALASFNSVGAQGKNDGAGSTGMMNNTQTPKGSQGGAQDMGSRPEAIEEQGEERMEERQENRKEKMQQNCETIRERVRARVMQFEDNKGVHVENYNNVVAKLEEIMTSLSDKGYDTSELSAAVETWKGMIQEYAVAYTGFINSLDNSSNYACGESGGEYKGMLTQAKEQHKNALELRIKARDYYAHEIREAIKNLRLQAVENSTTEE